MTFDPIILIVPFEVGRRGNEVRLILLNGQTEAAPVDSLVRAVALARTWSDLIVAGEARTLDDLVTHSGMTKRYVRRIFQCAVLSPDNVKRILDGSHPPNLTLVGLTNNLPLDWKSQDLNKTC